MIYKKTDLLCDRLLQQFADNGSAEMRTNFLAFTTDVLCGHAFDEDLDLLKDAKKAHDWHHMINTVTSLTPLAKQVAWAMQWALEMRLGPLGLVMPNFVKINGLRKVGHI